MLLFYCLKEEREKKIRQTKGEKKKNKECDGTIKQNKYLNKSSSNVCEMVQMAFSIFFSSPFYHLPFGLRNTSCFSNT